jgi:prefoldin subunit 5
MAILEDRGIKGAAATRKFRTAVTEATTKGISLNESLGISNDELDEYNKKIGTDAVGATNKYKAAADKQFGIMDKLKSAWEKLTLRMGGILTVLEPILGFMTAIGPVMIAVAMGAIPKLIASIKTVGIAMSTFAATPVGAVITAISLVTIGIVALVNLFKGSASNAIDKLKDKMKELGDTIISTMDEATNKAISDAENMAEEAKRPIQKLIDFLQGQDFMGTEGLQLLTDEQLARIKAVNPELAAQLETLQNGIKGIQTNYDALDESIRKKRIIEIQTELKNPLLTKQEQLDLYSELGRLTGEEWQNALRENAPDLVPILEQQKTDIDTALANQLTSWETHFAAIKAGWDGTADYVANTVMPAINEAVINGILTPEAAKKLTESFTTLMGQINQAIAKYTEKSPVTLTTTPERPWIPLPPDWWKNLPSKQYGGIVPGPIGQPIPILAHGGELFSGVYPGLENMGRSMGSGEIHQHFHVGTLIADEIGLREFMRRIKQLSGEDARRNTFAQVNQGYFYGRSSL